jgi:hypothetical protein
MMFWKIPNRIKFNKRLYNKYLSEIYKRFLLDVDFAEELAPILEKQQKLSNYEKLDWNFFTYT